MSNLQQKSRLTFIERTSSSHGRYICSCGVIKEIRINRVLRGEIISCGCRKKEPFNKGKHNLSHHPLYRILEEIKMRCYNPKSISYYNYGAVGVKICEEWLKDRLLFIKWSLENGWQKGLQIDKDIKAKELGVPPLLYSPERCLWVTRKENANCRITNHIIEYKGRKQNIGQWATELNFDKYILINRIKRKWSIERAFKTPVNKYNKNVFFDK